MIIMFLDAMASLESMLESERVMFFKILSNLGHIFRVCSMENIAKLSFQQIQMIWKSYDDDDDQPLQKTAFFTLVKKGLH